MFFEDAFISSVDRADLVYMWKTEAFYYKPRQWHGFVFFLNGPCHYIYPYKEFDADRDMFLYFPKGQIYEAHPEEDCSCILLNVNTANEINTDAFALRTQYAPQLRDIFLRAVTVYSRKRVGYMAEMVSLIYKIVSLIQSAEKIEYLPHSVSNKLDPAMDYIANHFHNASLKISDLAALCEMSERYFSQIFSAYYGLTPKQYILNMRMEMARSLLSNGRSTIKEIAEQCGFSNAYYFTRLFHETVGLSPTEYRKNAFF